MPNDIVDKDQVLDFDEIVFRSKLVANGVIPPLCYFLTSRSYFFYGNLEIVLRILKEVNPEFQETFPCLSVIPVRCSCRDDRFPIEYTP